jgi:hypothetical protein
LYHLGALRFLIAPRFCFELCTSKSASLHDKELYQSKAFQCGTEDPSPVAEMSQKSRAGHRTDWLAAYDDISDRPAPFPLEMSQSDECGLSCQLCINKGTATSASQPCTAFDIADSYLQARRLQLCCLGCICLRAALLLFQSLALLVLPRPGLEVGGSCSSSSSPLSPLSQ